MNPSSSSSSPRLPTRIPLWDDATTVVSEVTVPEQLDEEGGGDLGDDKEPLDSLDDSDVAMLSACPKKTAQQKTRDRTGRNRNRGGTNKAYYAKWAWVEKPFRKHQSK